MRQRLKSTAEVLHYWANRVKSKGYLGNTSFKGDTLYSYREPIGLLLGDDAALISNTRFSNTTSGHQADAMRAVSGRKVLRAPYIPHHDNYDEPLSSTRLNQTHIENKSIWTKKLEFQIESLVRHPRRKISVGLAIATITHEMKEYSDYFKLNWIFDEDAMAAARDGAEKRVAAQKAREKAQIEIQAHRLAEWRSGADTNMSFATTALRIKGDVIQTSRGAEIPVYQARRLWPMLCEIIMKKVEWIPQPGTLKLGVYTMNSFNADRKGTLVVGCHQIHWKEIVSIAAQLGFLEYSNALEKESTHA